MVHGMVWAPSPSGTGIACGKRARLALESSFRALAVPIDGAPVELLGPSCSRRLEKTSVLIIRP